MTSAQIGFVGFRIHLASGRGGTQIRSHFAYYVTSDLALQSKHVAQIAFVAVRPNMAIPLRMHELTGDPHAASRAPNRASRHRVHLSRARDLRQRLLRPLASHS